MEANLIGTIGSRADRSPPPVAAQDRSATCELLTRPVGTVSRAAGNGFELVG